MFFEVCLLSFGLFAGSELFKKIKLAARKEPYPPGRLKRHPDKQFQKRSSDKISIPKPAETAEFKKNSAAGEDYTEFKTAFETLTKEVSLLREEIVKLQKTETEIPIKVIQPVINKPSKSSEHPDKSSIFKQIIEDNINLRKMT